MMNNELTICELESYYNLTEKLIDKCFKGLNINGDKGGNIQERLNTLNIARDKIVKLVEDKINCNILSKTDD